MEKRSSYCYFQSRRRLLEQLVVNGTGTVYARTAMGSDPIVRTTLWYHSSPFLERSLGRTCCTHSPLFPDRHGMVATKATVILALEATVRGYGGPTVGANGSRLHGGRSFRVTGAQKLAAAGVEIIKIVV